MARKIIILDQTGGPADFRVAFWLDVPVARRPFYMNADATSEVIGATAGELTAIKDGAVKEFVENVFRDNGTTNAQLRAVLEARFTDLQNKLNASTKWIRYGSFWDGNAWTTVTVA